MTIPLDTVLHNLGVSTNSTEIVALSEPFDWENTSNVLLNLEEKFNRLKLPIKIQKKLLNITTEALDNVCKHSLKADDYNLSSFACKIDNGVLYIATRNLIHISSIKDLVKMIEDINNSDKEKINTNYRNQLKNGNLDDKGNAGLGFYQMARKSSEPIRFNFSSNSSTSAYFTYVIVIDTNK